MDNTQMAQSLFSALEQRDDDRVRQLCAPDFRARQNSNPAVDIDRVLVFSAAAHRVLQGLRYENAVRSATTSGFVEEHDVCGTLPDGYEFTLPVCVVAEIKGQKITALREYFDTNAAKGLIEGLKAL